MRVLIISFHFPPDAAIGAVRPYQFARLLPQHDIEPWVLTVEPQYAEKRDDRLTITDIASDRIVRTPVRETARGSMVKLASSWKGKLKQARQAQASQPVNAQSADAQGADAQPTNTADENGWLSATEGRRRLMAWLYFPDPLAYWFRPALATAHQMLQAHSFDAIISTSPPRIAHYVAFQLARRHNVPWIMDLRDPWYVDEVKSTALTTMQSALFQTCARRADLIVANTERLRSALEAGQPGLAAKTLTIPNGAAPRPATATAPAAAHPQFHIGHYGSVYSHRTAGTFLRGLRLWLDRHGEVPPELIVRFIGNEYGDAPRYIDELDLSGVVQLCPPVSRDQVYERMSQDYILLLLANDQPLQVPGKLYEYFAAGRRILATTEREGAVADMMRGEPASAIAESPEEVASALDCYWKDYTDGATATIDHQRIVEASSYERRTEQFASAIKDTVASRAGSRR